VNKDRLESDAFSLSSTASMIPGSTVTPIGLLITGWAAQKHVHWIVVDIVSLNPPAINASLTAHWHPLQGLALTGGGVILSFQSMQAYIVDAFPLYAASGLSLSLLCGIVPSDLE
jgi:hypothetical protein